MGGIAAKMSCANRTVNLSVPRLNVTSIIMGHHFIREVDGHQTLTMAHVGYTATVRYPAVRVLSFENLKKLKALLGHQNGDVLTRLCSDLLQTKSYIAYDGGEVLKDAATLEPVTIRGSKGVYEIPAKYKQGIGQVERVLASFEGQLIRQLSIVSSIDLYLVYTDTEISQCLGIIRAPLLALRELGEECTAAQGIVNFTN